MLPYRYVFPLALLCLASTVRSAPTSNSANNVATDTTNGLGARVGAAVNPSQVKEAHVPRGLPVHVAEGNADESSTSVPVQNYKNDMAQMPVLEDVYQPGTAGGQGDGQ